MYSFIGLFRFQFDHAAEFFFIFLFFGDDKENEKLLFGAAKQVKACWFSDGLIVNMTG